jgi:glycine dehydrogenase
MHPFAPPRPDAAIARSFADLERMLCAATGYDAVSLQPNAGRRANTRACSMIRAGTRAAVTPPRRLPHSRVRALAQTRRRRNGRHARRGRRLRRDGNVDLDDSASKAREHANDLAAIMVTYPSTHGVFESGIDRICAIVHEHGGQVYVDGAN